jgi:hypothetical protein
MILINGKERKDHFWIPTPKCYKWLQSSKPHGVRRHASQDAQSLSVPHCVQPQASTCPPIKESEHQNPYWGEVSSNLLLCPWYQEACFPRVHRGQVLLTKTACRRVLSPLLRAGIPTLPEIKTFHKKVKLKEFTTTKPALQRTFTYRRKTRVKEEHSRKNKPF